MGDDISKGVKLVWGSKKNCTVFMYQAQIIYKQTYCIYVELKSKFYGGTIREKSLKRVLKRIIKIKLKNILYTC